MPHFEKFDVGKLQDPKILQEFKLEIKNRFQLLENLSTEDTDTIPVNDEWQQIHKIYIEVRDRPFDLKGGYGFLFRSEFFFRTTQELEYLFFFVAQRAKNFSRILH